MVSGSLWSPRGLWISIFLRAFSTRGSPAFCGASPGAPSCAHSPASCEASPRAPSCAHLPAPCGASPRAPSGTHTPAACAAHHPLELHFKLTLQLLVQLIILLSFILSSFSSPVQLIFQHPERAATIIGETTPSRHFSTSYHHRSYLHTKSKQLSPLQIIKIHQILNIPNLICLFVKYFNI